MDSLANLLGALSKLVMALAWTGLAVWVIMIFPADKMREIVNRASEVSFGPATVKFSQASPQSASSDAPGVSKPPPQAAKAAAEQLENAIVGIVSGPSGAYPDGNARYHFAYQLNPSVPAVKEVTFTFPHPSMDPRLRNGVTVKPGESVGYDGWGCLRNIQARVEFQDGSTETVSFDGCAKVGWN